jgi:hypothetical protein
MTIDMHIVRKVVIGVFLLMVLMAELTILATATSAQDYATGSASAPSPISAGSPTNSAASGTSNPPISAVNPSQVPPNASLLAVPVVGTTPLTVDFLYGSYRDADGNGATFPNAPAPFALRPATTWSCATTPSWNECYRAA